MAEPTRDTDRGMAGIIKQLKKLAGASITVGIHEDAGVDEHGTSVAEIGAVHEYGKGHVPARPWLANTIDENRAELNKLMAKVADRIMMSQGKIPLTLGLSIVGERAAQLVQDKIRSSDPTWAPLAEETKKAKARKGRLKGEAAAAFIGGDGNPLVDTSQMLNSVRSKVEAPSGG